MAITIKKGADKRTSRTQDNLKVIQTTLASLDGTLSSGISGLALAGENLSTPEAMQFNNALDALTPVIEQLSSQLPTSKLADLNALSSRQNAAAWGAMMAMNPRETARREIMMPTSRGALHRVVESDGFGVNTLAQECLNTDCGDDMITTSLLFNMNACAGMSGLVGSLYPMMVLDPSMSGFSVVASLIYIHNGMTHDANGALANYKRTNLIRAYADHTVLESGGILAIPVWTATSAAAFVDVATIGTVARTKSGETFQTSYLKNGTELDLIGLSQTPNSLTRGAADQTYSLQKDISVTNVLVTVDGDAIDFNMAGIMSTRFTRSSQGEGTGMVMALETKSISFTPDTLLADGSPLTGAANLAMQAANATATLRLEASGRADILTGAFRITSLGVTVVKVTDSNGEEIPLASAPAAAFVTAMSTAVVEGWKVRAFICPQNLSVECIQVNSDCYREEHFVPYVCTVSTKRMINDDNTTDLDNLLHLARVRMENSAATHLLDTVDQLEDLYRAARLEERPDVLGIGRLYVRPTFIKKTLDITTVTSRRAGERHEDIRAMINDAISEIASRLYTTSELQAARCHVRPDDEEKPTVNIITSTHIAAYVATTGILATLTNMFNMRMSVTPDRRFDDADVGKIIITFSNYDDERASEFDPLSWGSMVYSPEVVYNVNRPVGKAYINELLVSPRYKAISGLPVAGVITVSGLSQSVIGDSSPW